jgi:hypothetical protein
VRMPQIEGDDGRQTTELPGDLVQARGVPGLLPSGDQDEHVVAGTEQASEDRGGRVGQLPPGEFG